MPEPTTPAEPTEFDTITWQLAMAFGQGAGTMLATPAAVSAALAPYREWLVNNTAEWNSVALLFIEYTRALGTLSSRNAANAGAAVMDTSHVQTALVSISGNTLFPLGPCNCLVASRRPGREPLSRG